MTRKESLDDDSSKHDVSAPNLDFKKWGGRKKEAVPDDSRDRKRTNFQDIHVDMVNAADQDQDKVQSINNRVQNKQQVHAPTKFKNFSRPQQFTSSKGGKGGAHHTQDGGDL